MDTLWLVNGQRAGMVAPGDRGLAYGDGLFETMAARAGRIRWLDYHLDRLAEGCERLGITGVDRQTIRREIDGHCPRSGAAVVKLVVTRGVGARGYCPPDRAQPTRILSISSWPDYPSSHYTRGITVRTCALRLGENPELAGLKHLNRLEQVLAQRALRGSGADEGLLLDSSGQVAGGTASNVFAVRGRELLTPTLRRCGVKGVMRRVVLESAARADLEPAERDLTPADVSSADELFVTNALFGIWPVRELDGRAYPVGGHTRRLMRALGYGTDA